MPLLPFLQYNFRAMNRQSDPSNLNFSGGEYALGVNIRTRNNGPEPIGEPLDITSTIPTITKLQGIYGFDNFLIVFGDGRAYIRDYNVSSILFTQVPGFQMDPEVSEIFAIEVPASTVNYVRIPTVVSSVVQTSGIVTLTTAYEGAPSVIICQDGINQPQLILPDGTSRPAQTFDQWSTDNKEYIPIGNIMWFVNNKTYIMIKDGSGKYTLQASSVSGRPCDFVVAIDNNGNKVSPESVGGAIATAYSVSYTPITCASATGGSQTQSGQGVSFYVGNQSFSYLVVPNYNNTIFGEPTYSNSPLFSTGPSNNNSLIDLLGDTALIDSAGVRSFNAILQTRFEGRNSPFSLPIQSLFGDVDSVNGTIVQTVTAATQWVDYGMFSVQTIYGPAVIIYDTIAGAWVGIDLFSNISGNIKQFADIKTTSGIRELFFITDDNKVYQYLAGNTAEAGFYLGDATPIGNGSDLKPIQFIPVFARVRESGRVNVDVFVNSQKVDTFYRDVTKDSTISSGDLNQYPLELPFGINAADQVRCPSFDMSKIEQGWKIGYWVTWNFKAMLLVGQMANDARLLPNTIKQQASDYAQLNAILAPSSAPGQSTPEWVGQPPIISI